MSVLSRSSSPSSPFSSLILPSSASAKDSNAPLKAELDKMSSEIALIIISELNTQERARFIGTSLLNESRVHLLTTREIRELVLLAGNLISNLSARTYANEIRLIEEGLQNPIIQNPAFSKQNRLMIFYQLINTIFGEKIKDLTFADLGDNRNLMLILVKIDGKLLKHASVRLKDDLEVVKNAVRRHGIALEFASDRLKKDPGIVKTAVTQDGWALKHASENLLDDSNIVETAVKQCGWALMFASDRLKDNLNIVRAAVSQEGWALKYASTVLRGNLEIVKAAAAQTARTLLGK